MKLHSGIRLIFMLALVAVPLLFTTCQSSSEPTEWPAVSRQTKPWTRWWWMGNAVNQKDLTTAMETYKKAGLGGLELTPIYGVKGYEDQFINFLSPRWMDNLVFTLNEAKKLDMGVDMATGTGWPFGGPWIGPDSESKYITYRKYQLSGGEKLKDTIKLVQRPYISAIGHRIKIDEVVRPIRDNKNLQALAIAQVRFPDPMPLQTLMAYSDNGEVMNLTESVDKNGILNWTAPAGEWTLYALFEGWHGKMVERAAPGGEGLVLDHFSTKALKHYLSAFDSAFEGNDISYLRAFFNDSYEVDDAMGEADWTPEFFSEFRSRKGYDLREQLPALFNQDTTEKHIRVLSDFRDVISALLLDNFTKTWKQWAEKKSAIIRNQAHGSPANILDLYAASTIPETEGTNIYKIKFASSASNVTGKQLTSSESATWLNEHFSSTLGDVKDALDRYFLGGVNHIFYHGTAYSPQNDKWPGWMFYAAVHFQPDNSFWSDFSKLNDYVTRCQSFLQTGNPDNDVLLYFPFYDRIADPGRSMLEHFSGDGPRNKTFPYQGTAVNLQENGYSFDYISDRQIMDLKAGKRTLSTGKSTYKTIVIPAVHYIPLATMKQLMELAQNGATIIFTNNLPEDVPGYNDLAERRTQLKALTGKLQFAKDEATGLQIAGIGKGTVVVGSGLNDLLTFAGVKPEPMNGYGLQYIRKKTNDGTTYFIKNSNQAPFKSWVTVQANASSAALFNPMSLEKGMAQLRKNNNGKTEVYLQLSPGETCILRTFNGAYKGTDYPIFQQSGDSIRLLDEWNIKFVTGGPEMPAAYTSREPVNWTDISGDWYNDFSGTADYSIEFNKPGNLASRYVLDLGIVHESARVVLNGEEIGTRIHYPYTFTLSAEQLKENNKLEVYVSNLMANRIAWMDRNNINYEKFYNVNFPPHDAKDRGKDGLFTAVDWSPVPSGLQGPVSLVPMEKVSFDQQMK
ncbi:MAG TPA: glycosyl hydrolase [Bacteroidales bacterium]|nr:glycosyl hydrolase [Bacteroidales bacterium]